MTPDSGKNLEERIKLLESELRNRESEIALLKETSDAVGSELQFDKLLALVAERAQKLMRAETLLIPILNNECGEYTYRAGCGKNADEVVGESLPLDYGICGWVWKHKRPWWRGMLNELNPEERNEWEREAGSVLLVPLIGKRHFLGGISCIGKIGGGEFDKRDLDLLSMFASQVAVALENAEFFTEIDASRKQLVTYQDELKLLNAELEERVTQRTAELATLNQELKRIALYDPLTGLANRALILDRVQQTIFVANREKKPFSVIMMDLNKFKEINDTLGHHMGDELLKNAARRFESALRKSDTVGRLGGDEFAIIIPGASIAGAIVVAKKIMRALIPTVMLDRHEITISASLGIAEFPVHGQDTTSLLKSADAAMYVAKRSKAPYAIFNSTTNAPTITAVSQAKKTQPKRKPVSKQGVRSR